MTSSQHYPPKQYSQQQEYSQIGDSQVSQQCNNDDHHRLQQSSQSSFTAEQQNKQRHPNDQEEDNSQNNGDGDGEPQAEQDLDSNTQGSNSKRHSRTGSDHNQSSLSSNSRNIQLSDQQKLEREILHQVSQSQHVTSYQKQLTYQLFEKLKDFKLVSKGKHGQDLITIRIQELVINRLLVLTHQRSDFRLVLAHYHLGKAYLVNDCNDQAIQHISTALHKNQKMFQMFPSTKLLQTYFQNQLAAALLNKQNYDDAIQILNSSIAEQNRIKEQMSKQTENLIPKNIKALILLSQCYLKTNNNELALQVIQQVINITKKRRNNKQQFAFALVDKSKIMAEMKNYQQAIVFQQQAIDILMQQNYSNPEQVAIMYSVLSRYHEELGSIENALTCTQKVKTLYQQLYSAEDKKVIKARRKIATYLLKGERFKEAVNELLEVVELEEKVFGENSLQTARTLKLLGAVYISIDTADARAYLKRSMNIYSHHGNKKQVEQIKGKLKMLLSGQNGHNIDTKLISENQL